MVETFIINLLNRLWRPRRQPASDGLFLGHAHDAHGHRVDVHIPQAVRAEHVVIVGKTGSGKTHLLQLMANEHMRRSEGFVLFDFHGDCTAAVLALAATHADAERRLVLIDPTDEHSSPGLNPLEHPTEEARDIFGRVSELSAILRARWHVDQFGPRSEELLRNVLYTLAVHGLTLVEAPLLLTSSAFRQRRTAALPSADITAYWQNRFEPLSEAMKASFREPLLNRITAFLIEPSTRHLLGQTRSTVDFGDAMRSGRWVLINLSRGILREHAHTLGNLIFAKLQFEVFGRIREPPQRRRLFSILVDEVQNLAENDLATLLVESRKFSVSITTANQYWEQLPRHLRGALLACGTHIFFRISHADASTLAAELDVRSRQRYAAELPTLPRGQAFVRAGDAPAVRVRVPPSPTLPADAMANSERLRTLSVALYARSRAQVEREILARSHPPDTPAPRLNETSHATPHEGQHEW